MKKPKAPAAPDPAATAAAQTASNKETALWNASLQNVNQITPYGNLIYTQTAGGPRYNQAAYDTAMQQWSAAGAPNRPAPTMEQWFAQGSPGFTGRSGDMQRDFANWAATQTAGGARGQMPTLEQFKIGDAPPQFTSTITLNPESQKLLDTQLRSENALASLGEAQLGRISSAVSTPFSFAGLGDAPTAESIAQQAARGEEALMARMNPQFQRDEEAMRTRLINQGIGQGSEAYNREMEAFNQARNDARMQAILQGASLGGSLQNQALQRRQQAINEYTTQRNAPLNEYTAMTSGAQVQNPQFQSTNYTGAAPVDYAGLINQNYQNQMAQYNAGVGSRNALMGSLFSLGGSFLGGPAGGTIAGKLFGG